MPYIKKGRRGKLKPLPGLTGSEVPQNAAELTYRFVLMMDDYLADKPELTYGKIAECLGALEGARFDLECRVLRPFQARKLAANGDVWSDVVLKRAEL